MSKILRLLLILLIWALSGCIAKVEWEERKDHWLPVCPSCRQVVNFQVLQCNNPKCKTLLRWRDKKIEAKQIYGEGTQQISGQQDKTPESVGSVKPTDSTKVESQEELKNVHPQTNQDESKADISSHKQNDTVKGTDEKSASTNAQEDTEEGFQDQKSEDHTKAE